ncbi:hypothetical protein MKW98_018046 [Papaver atlanticum]|uniref:Uncharacterized protein n=1 Tax=Papaver atlanticum TaxID=357466 RepID=A0AAD4TF75_9MAGN|nr:hypothetical protein MKW98_018046 [Papaver atlanticum]
MRASSIPASRTTVTTVALFNQESPLPSAWKHGKLQGSKSLPATTTNWKPSLCAIMEDEVVLPTMVIGAETGKKRTVKSDRNGVRKSISIADIRLKGNNNLELRRSSSFSTVQAFFPASSFLF